MATKRRKKKKSLLLRLLCVLAVCYFSVTLINNYNKIAVKKRELEVISESCDTQKLSNEELEHLLSLSDSQAYVERIARDKLGFVYPDERIFIDVSGK